MKEICRGCPTSSIGSGDADGHVGGRCTFIQRSKEEQCPCIYCLIKVMCNKNCRERLLVLERLRHKSK